MRRSFSISTVNLVIIIFLLMVTAFRPLAMMRAHLDDSVLLAQLGWRGMAGLTPVLDYPHFWSGITSVTMAFTFEIFGPTFKAIDYALIVFFLWSTALLVLMCWKRLGMRPIIVLVTLSAALIVSGQPIELGFPNSTHSFVYNHVAITLMMGLLVFGLLKAEDSRVEIVGALVAGFTLYLLAMLKPTFSIIAPFVVLACLVQGRWIATSLVLVGAAVTMLVLDFGMVRVMGSFEYVFGSLEADRAGGVGGLINKALRIIARDFILLAVAATMLGAMLVIEGRRAVLFIFAAALLAAGYGAAILTMGGIDDLKLVPALVVFFLVGIKVLQADTLAEDEAQGLGWGLMKAIPVCMAYGVVAPAVVSSAIAGMRSVQFADAVLIEEGPLSTYFIYGDATRGLWREDLPDADAYRAEATERAMKKLVKDPVFVNEWNTTWISDDSVEFVMFADGVDLLQDIPDIQEKGIIPGATMFDFTFALGAKAMPNFPIWPSPSYDGTELRSFEAMPPEVDLVMVLNYWVADLTFTPVLMETMGGDFKPCRVSEFWTLYDRRAAGSTFCEAEISLNASQG